MILPEPFRELRAMAVWPHTANVKRQTTTETLWGDQRGQTRNLESKNWWEIIHSHCTAWKTRPHREREASRAAVLDARPLAWVGLPGSCPCSQNGESNFSILRRMKGRLNFSLSTTCSPMEPETEDMKQEHWGKSKPSQAWWIHIYRGKERVMVVAHLKIKTKYYSRKKMKERNVWNIKRKGKVKIHFNL